MSDPLLPPDGTPCIDCDGTDTLLGTCLACAGLARCNCGAGVFDPGDASLCEECLATLAVDTHVDMREP